MQLPLVPLRDVVIFPGVVTSLFVGRDKSIKSLQTAMESDKSVMLVAQKNLNREKKLELGSKKIINKFLFIMMRKKQFLIQT